jgi:hypothetical protein
MTAVQSDPSAATIDELFSLWRAVREEPSLGNDEDPYERYRQLQVAITSREPASTKDFAIQIIVDTDFGDSEPSKAFLDRVLTIGGVA